jgi:hypothetical protein
MTGSWPTAAYLRPSAVTDRVVARDPLTGIQLACRSHFFSAARRAESVETVARQLTGHRDAMGINERDISMASDWLGHGWSTSLEYYLDSRRVRFADTADGDGSVRNSVLREYLSEDGPPSMIAPEGTCVPLPPPSPGASAMRLSELLVDRRSVRAFSGHPVSAEAVSDFLWAGLCEVRQCRAAQNSDDPLSLLRSYGTAWVFTLVVYDVTGIQPGAYQYDVSNHHLIQMRTGDFRDAMVRVFRGMQAPRTACLTVGLVADAEAYQWRYRHPHALRRLYVESGSIAQYLLAASRASKLEGFVTPAQHDSEFLDVVGCQPNRHIPVHTLTLGTRQRVDRREDAK